MTPRRPVEHLLPVEIADAREAMRSLIASRSLSVREDEPGYPAEVARLSWAIADAMRVERRKRAR